MSPKYSLIFYLLVLLLTVFIELPVIANGSLSKQQEPKSSVEAFFDAIKNNDIKRIESLLDINPTLIDSAYTSTRILGSSIKLPIHEALKYGSYQTIDLLLARGANPGKLMIDRGLFNYREISSLEILVMNRDLEMVKCYFNQLGVTPRSYAEALVWASENGKNNVVRFLLSVGEEVLVKE